jgi:hypothetical protein
MAPSPYPLRALRELRDDEADAQAHALAEQLVRVGAAERLLEQRVAARRGHAERTRDSLAEERSRLLARGSSGAELRRAVEFETAARVQAELLQRAEAEAQQQLERERATAQELREALGRREADAQLVRNHESNFHAQAAERAARAEEEAALEQWNARRR